MLGGEVLTKSAALRLG
jgi:hypothetical protein